MKYLFYEKETDTKAKVTLIYHVEPPVELTNKGSYITVNNIPEPEHIEGKAPILHCNPKIKELWYKYENIPLTEVELQKEKIQELENALMEMSTLQAIKDMENEQAIMELTTMITMMGGM